MAPASGHLPEHRPPVNGGWRLTVAYMIMGIAIVGSAALAIFAVNSSRSVCAYQKQVYPVSRLYRIEVKGFIHDHYLHLKEEARAYRDSAAQDPDAVTARLDLTLAAILEAHARIAYRDWRKITIPGPPTCS